MTWKDKIAPGTVSLLLSVVVFIITRAITEDKDRLALAAGLTTLLVGILVTVWFSVTRAEVNLAERIQRAQGVNEYLRVITLKSDREKEVDTILASAARVFESSHPFLKRRASDVLFEVNGRLSTLASGRFECTPDEELHLTKEVLLEDTCRHSVKAVSYQDEEWWSSIHGEVYLNIHRELLKRTNPVYIQRVFIARSATDSALTAVVEKQRQLGIDTIILEEELVPEDLRLDFVLYDDELLRTAQRIAGGLAKGATFSIVEGEVSKAKRDYQTLLQIAAARDARASGSGAITSAAS